MHLQMFGVLTAYEFHTYRKITFIRVIYLLIYIIYL